MLRRKSTKEKWINLIESVYGQNQISQNGFRQIMKDVKNNAHKGYISS
jgi:hypothetical protein